jgi:hypothetical protein
MKASKKMKAHILDTIKYINKYTNIYIYIIYISL